MTMKLNINDRAALAIKNGSKKVEIRANKKDSGKDYGTLKTNDIIEFNSKNLGELYVKVKEVNEYVKKGETVISGSIYLNEELKENVKAMGEVYGEVWYKLSVEYPIINDLKEETGNKKTVYSINFFDNSFILFNFSKYFNHLFENTIKLILI